MAFTKAQLIDGIAEKTNVEKKIVEAMLDCLAQLAYEHAKDEFVLPGIGKLVLVDRKARTARNPQTGAQMQIPAKRALKSVWRKRPRMQFLVQHPLQPPMPQAQHHRRPE